MSDAPELKYRPEEFLVRENLVVELTEADGAQYEYLLLRKCGFTTMEAIRVIADKLGLPSVRVTFCGLKDEDGVTEQLIAVPIDSRADGVIFREDGRWARLHHYGYGLHPLEIGGLEGNSFRVTIRNVAKQTARDLAERGKVTLLFLNYYDVQRFGVPAGPKRTHLVGKSICEGDYKQALARLIELGTPESNQASCWQGEPRDFFLRLDPRVPLFYLSAYSSSHFNEALCELATKVCPDHLLPIELEGLRYIYVSSPDAAAAVMAKRRELSVCKYALFDGQPKPRESVRQTVTQAIVSIGADWPDEAHPGRSRIDMRFALPSGSYATTAIRQMLRYASWGGNTGC